MSRDQFLRGFLNLSGEVAMPATFWPFCEIETDTRDSRSPVSQSSTPRARTAPLTIFSGDLKLDRILSPPQVFVSLSRRRGIRKERSRPLGGNRVSLLRVQR